MCGTVPVQTCTDPNCSPAKPFIDEHADERSDTHHHSIEYTFAAGHTYHITFASSIADPDPEC